MQDIPYLDFQSKHLKKKKKNKFRFLLYFLLVLIVVFTVYTKLLVNNKLISPAVNTLGINNFFQAEVSLDNTVKQVMQNTQGTYGIAIKNLKNGESYFFNEDRVFAVGSLYKLWIMATAYKQITNEKLDKSEVLNEKIAALNKKFDIDADLAEQTEGEITLSVRDALNQMITISHNYAALLLTEKIRLSSVATFLKENNLTKSIVGTSGGNPTSTPYDILLFLEKLYKGELANAEYTEEMINLLKGQKLNGGLPKYIGQVQVAHKTGDFGWFKHDAGIVFTSSGDYIIVVMSESDYPQGAQEKIALLSKAVFDYFSSNQR